MSNNTEEKIRSLIVSQKIINNDQFFSLKINEKKINIILNADTTTSITSKISQITGLLKDNFPGYDLNILSTGTSSAASKNLQKNDKLKPDNIKHIIMVSSCKGGVGKSTVTTLLAKTLAKCYKVGILDADIYGPSIPYLLGMEEKITVENNKFIPLERDNIQAISMGHIIDKEKATIWRAPMITKSLHQLMMGTNWQDLDILLIDTPPGTGDVALSLTKEFAISGVILVSTPEILAVNEIVKTIDMFNKMKIPILGAIENMSYIEDSSGKKNYIFGQGHLENILNQNYIKCLANIPLLPELNNGSETKLDQHIDIYALEIIINTLEKKKC